MIFSIHSLAIKTALSLAVVASMVPVANADGDIFNKTLRSTAWVLTQTDEGISSGTGVLIDAEKKLVVTNFHVVGEARAAVIFFPVFKDGRVIVDKEHYKKNITKISVKGRVLAIDRKRDLAIVELDSIPEGIEPLPLAEKGITQGEDVQSVGNPGASGALWVFNSGTVRTIYQKQFRTGTGAHDFMVVETQSPVNSGDSGGPVVNNDGELVAIAQATSRKGSLISYNVDISEVKAFLKDDWKRAPLPVVDTLTQADLTYKQALEKQLEVSFEQKDKTLQSVFVAKDVEYFEHANVRRVWSLAASLSEVPDLETQMKLLEQNGRTKLGAWTIEQTKEGQYLIVFACKLDASATPRTLKSTMEYVARLTTLGKKSFPEAQTTAASSDVLGDWLGK